MVAWPLVVAGTWLASLVAATAAAGQPAAPPAAATQASAASRPASGGPLKRTREQVEALIEQAGKTRPPWWDSVEVTYPPTLDLTWSNDTGDWDPQHKLGHYLWSVIGANPQRFKEGTKLLHHVLVVNKDNPERLARTMDRLGWAYFDLLEDYPRAVFWWRKAARLRGQQPTNYVALARAYYRMGSREMAQEILNRLGADTTGNSGIVRTWAEMGETQKALALARGQVASGLPDAGYLAMADIYRQTGRLNEALECYQKALEATSGSRGIEKNKKRARINAENIRILAALNLGRVADGTYTGSALGYIGDVGVRVTIKGGRIESIDVIQTREDRPMTALQEMPARILEKQDIQGVDVVSGATVTSDAIIYATGGALLQGMRK